MGGGTAPLGSPGPPFAPLLPHGPVAKGRSRGWGQSPQWGLCPSLPCHAPEPLVPSAPQCRGQGRAGATGGGDSGGGLCFNLQPPSNGMDKATPEPGPGLFGPWGVLGGSPPQHPWVLSRCPAGCHPQASSRLPLQIEEPHGKGVLGKGRDKGWVLGPASSGPIRGSRARPWPRTGPGVGTRRPVSGCPWLLHWRR